MADNQITILTGPDRIRKRAAVVYLSNDLEGAQHAVRDVLDIFVTEAQLGRCKHLSVKQDGAKLEISGDDRGIYLGQDTGDDTKWQEIFCSMYPLPAYCPDESGYSLGLIDYAHHTLYGEAQQSNSIYFPEETGYMELYALQCASEYLEVVVNRDGINSKLYFERGYNIGGIHNEPTTECNGTCFWFALDHEVFTQTVIPATFFLETLKSFAMLSPGLCCTYENASGQATTFYYPDGISEYVQHKCPENTVPVYRKKIEAKGKDRYNRAEYAACVDIVIGYTPNEGEVKCFHNFRELTSGGSHWDALQKQICRAFNACYGHYIVDDGSDHVEHSNGETETFNEVAKHLTVVLATWCSPYCSVWGNGERLSIRNRMIADMTHDATGAEFHNYLYRNKEKYLDLLEHSMLDQMIRTMENAR